MTDLYTALVANVIFPLQERLKHHTTVTVRRRMEISQWWTPGHLQHLQLQRLQTLLAHARQHVPYYTQLFEDLAFDPTTIHSLEDLRRLPFLTKPLIRSNLEALKARNATRLMRFNTGGSSGEPLIFFLGDERVSHDVAAKWRATRWWNVDIGDPEIVIWGSPVELKAQDRLREWRDRLMRTQLLPAFEMSAEKLASFMATIRAMRPKMLFGYPSSIAHIARHARAVGQRMDDIGVQVAFVTAERLYDDQRRDIAQIFGCRVANGYGGRDAGFIAHECPAGGMHVTAEDIIVEIVNGEGRVLPPGESGEVVITHLATRDFPFIRYRTGDVATLSAELCSCGRGLPLLQEIHGRTTDFVVAHNGTIMHGLALIYVLRDLPGVIRFKIIQESLEKTIVMLVPGPEYTAATEQRIVAGLRERLGAQVEIKVLPVTEIPQEASGKFRYIVSRVSPGATPR